MATQHGRNRLQQDHQVEQHRPALQVEEVEAHHVVEVELGAPGDLPLSRELIAERLAPGVVSDLANLMRDLSRDGKLAGFEVSERFYEAGSPEGLRDLEQYLSRS